MSYGFYFWRYKTEAMLDHQQVCERLSDGEHVGGLEYLPIGQMTTHIREAFTGWKWLDDVTAEGPNGAFVDQLMLLSALLRMEARSVVGRRLSGS
jgi:hypothetical protein